METTGVKGICLICLSKFDVSSSDKKDTRYEPRYITAGAGFQSTSFPEDDTATDSFKRSYDDIYTRFLHFSCRYLKLTSTAEVFLMASTSYKNATGQSLQAFCENCKYLVSYVCDLYAELQALKIRLISKLRLIEEVMEDRKKFMPRMLLSKLGMELKEQLHVNSRMRVDSFRMAFHQKCKSKLKNETPRVLVPRGVLPDEWKFGYPSCKSTLMRLIIIFALASSKILPSKENDLISTRKNSRPQVARRRIGRPKSQSILKANNEIPEDRIQPPGRPDDIIKTETKVMEGTEDDSKDNKLPHNLENDNNSEFSDEAPSPMSIANSAAGSDDEYKPYSENAEDTVASPGKRWNLCKRKRKVIVECDSSDSDHNDNDNDQPNRNTKKADNEKVMRWKDRENHRKKVHPIKRTYRRRRHRPKEAQSSEKPKKPAKLMKKAGRPKKPDAKTRKCQKCNLYWDTLEDLQKHKLEVHLKDKYSKQPQERKCLRCPLVFMNFKELRHHNVMVHGRKRPFQGPGRPPLGPTKCIDCDKQFPAGREMMAHRKAEHTYRYLQYVKLLSGEFKCKKCDETFATKARFKVHLKRHQLFKSKMIEICHCEVCVKHFLSRNALQDHMTKVHQDKYPCYVCKASIETGKLLREHLVEHEKPEKYFYCMVCFQGFSNLQYYDIHRVISHRDNGKFHCDYNYCNEIVDTMEQLATHLETHLQDGRTKDTAEEWKDVHKCEVCNKPFIKIYNFTVHSLTHTEQNKDKTGYDCPLCGHTVRTMDTLTSHYNRVHGLNIMTCKCYICGRAFSSRLHYISHIRECAFAQPQSSEKNLICNFCGAKFDDKASLMKHKKEIHYAEKFSQGFRKLVDQLKVCPEEGCGEMRTSSQMNVHLARAHEKGDKYPCEKCGKTYVNLKYLKDHLAKHGVGKHRCGTCGKAFAKPCYLKKHELDRHSENPAKSFCCHLCGSSYFSKQGLRFHNWSMHKDEYSKELRFECPYCERRYGRKFLWTSHVNNCQAKDKTDDGDKEPRKKLRQSKLKNEKDEEEMTDKSTAEDENEEDKPKEKKSTSLSQVAPNVYPHQMPQSAPSSSSLATITYHQWLNMTAAPGLGGGGGGEGQQQINMASLYQKPIQAAEVMGLQSQSTLHSGEKSLHQL